MAAGLAEVASPDCRLCDPGLLPYVMDQLDQHRPLRCRSAVCRWLTYGKMYYITYYCIYIESIYIYTNERFAAGKKSRKEASSQGTS